MYIDTLIKCIDVRVLFAPPAVDCGPLSDPDDGIVELDGTSVGDSATYRCNTGFILFGKGIRVCNPDGLWNGKAPVCTGMGLLFINPGVTFCTSTHCIGS